MIASACCRLREGTSEEPLEAVDQSGHSLRFLSHRVALAHACDKCLYLVVRACLHDLALLALAAALAHANAACDHGPLALGSAFAHAHAS